MSETGLYEQAASLAERIRQRCDRKPTLALVLGSGLGAFADSFAERVKLPYAEIEGFPVSSVHGHAGNLVFGKVGAVEVVAMQGRIHYYECGDMQRITLPIRVLRLLGVSKLVATNAAGGLGKDLGPGDLMLIHDHINLMMAGSPLVGPNDERFGPRFPDMSEAYDRKMGAGIRRAAEALGITLKQGVYCAFHGPEYETPSEVRMAGILGADAVGMSTVPEIVVANHMGMRCAGISCISNFAAGITAQKLNHQEVMEVSARVAATFTRLLAASIPEIDAA